MLVLGRGWLITDNLCQFALIFLKLNQTSREKESMAIRIREERVSLTVLLLLGMFALQVSANVVGFDFGSTFFKVTLVQPGKPF